ncbi:hypothetical protein BDP27DRAFT_1329342 [Rhodocollybia butyracea]|uniref:Uncharacterized protein n=1 Tax=Rhodocollybia butyracea TaxID=206335 RepID=A0A9P5U4U7_9AGAR|nr:hypothetical protein BDP27DRAFT_1329342 [Rhodocollybia butyracea]
MVEQHFYPLQLLVSKTFSMFQALEMPKDLQDLRMPIAVSMPPDSPTQAIGSLSFQLCVLHFSSAECIGQA